MRYQGRGRPLGFPKKVATGRVAVQKSKLWDQDDNKYAFAKPRDDKDVQKRPVLALLGRKKRAVSSSPNLRPCPLLSSSGYERPFKSQYYRGIQPALRPRNGSLLCFDPAVYGASCA